MCNHLTTVSLKVSDIRFSYGKKETLKGIDLELQPSQILGILGPNGSGKTTLLKCINRILVPSQGEILLGGSDISKMSRLDISKNMSYVPQNAKLDLCTPTVFEIVLMGRRPHITWQFGKKDQDIVWKCLDELGIRHLAARSFDSLSSGQSQRVLMARALAQEAKVLLLDEPTSNLDVKYQRDVMESVRMVVDEKKIGACAIIHDLDLALRFCDVSVLLNEGRIVCFGRTEDVLTSENIKEVFGVDSCIETIRGTKHLIVL